MVDEQREALVSEGERDAYDTGLSRGWEHANFVEAYGKEHERRGPDYPGWLGEGNQPTRYGAPITTAERHAERQAFAQGWTLGRKRFARGQFADGSKVPD